MVAWIRPNPCEFFCPQSVFAALYAANSAAVGILVSGDGLTSRSQVMFGAGVRISPHMASHMLMILVDDWNLLYHCPQLGPSSVGMWNLLISIFVNLYLYDCLLQAKGAYTSRYWMPGVIVSLAHIQVRAGRCQGS